MQIKWKKFIPAVAIPLLVGALSSVLTKNNMAVYNQLDKPALSPPDWIFPIVWTILFTMMGIASYLVDKDPLSNSNTRSALILYAIQLVFNFCWTLVFFNLQFYLLAFIWLLLLLFLIVVTTVKFFNCTKAAGYLMIPYLLWSCFAAYLNLMIAIKN